MASFRHSKDDLWEKSSILFDGKHPHDPYLVLSKDGMKIYDTLAELVADAELSDDNLVYWQWKGEWRSDFFEVTLGEIKAHL